MTTVTARALQEVTGRNARRDKSSSDPEKQTVLWLSLFQDCFRGLGLELLPGITFDVMFGGLSWSLVSFQRVLYRIVII